MRALTDKDFKKKLQKTNPRVIAVGKYINRTTKIEFACYKCGKIQSALPQNLFKHSGLCADCSNKMVATNNAKTHEEFIAELQTKNPNIKITGKYVNAFTKIEWECSKCRKKLLTRPNSLYTSKGLCSECLYKSRFLADEVFKKKIKELNPDIKVTGTYIDSNTKIEWACSVCGEKQYSNPKILPGLSGICNKCKANIKKEYFYKEFSKLKVPPILLTSYQGITKKIKCKCSVCKHIWASLPDVILTYKYPCPKCAKLARFSDKEEFKHKLYKINPNIELLEEYQGNGIPIGCKCKLCENAWKSRPNDLLRRKGCPECNHTNTSFVEQLLFLSLKNVLGEKEVLSRSKSVIGKELDIYIPKKQYAVEYGAWFWHKNRLKNDQNKIEKCKIQNIKLLCIYDSCPENLHIENAIIFREDLSQNLDLVKKLLSTIFSEINVKYSFSEDEWAEIKEKAYIQSRKMTTDEFRKELKKINKNIRVLGEYKGSYIKTRVRCLKCANEWNVTPKELLKGTGCLKCYRIKQFDGQEEFQKKVAKINPKVEILGLYKGRRNRIETKCKICGHVWNPLANNLAQGKGCPKCKTHKQMIMF